MCGLDTDDKTTGYKKIIIKPHPGGNLSYASASLNTYYGRVKSAWKQDSTAFHLSVEIPANTTATIYLPATKNAKVDINGKPVDENGSTSTLIPDNYRTVNVGSGTYDFTVR
jgi:alpha-L-rhamnosidase